jgi:hypothetical protein
MKTSRSPQSIQIAYIYFTFLQFNIILSSEQLFLPYMKFIELILLYSMESTI